MEEINSVAFSHRSVLLTETIEALDIKENGIYLDCTAGGGGHSYEIAKRLKNGLLIALDRDEEAVEAATERLREFGGRAKVIHSNFADFSLALKSLGVDKIDGALMDLGVSSYQLDNAQRGFSYSQDAPLDMRMDRDASLSAYDVVNTYGEDALVKLIFDFGEERFARAIVSKIAEKRKIKPIETTLELSDIIKSAIPAPARAEGHHPAKRTFQAIRIEVNSELSVIEPTIKGVVGALREGGRIAVITFHSLEDRVTKQTFAQLSSGCTCPRDFPVCICGGRPQIKLINKKPILPGERELRENPRARSAKLRSALKI